MGLKSKPEKALPIGVDLGFGNLKMAQLRTCGSNVDLLAAASAEVPPDCRDDLARRLDFLSGKIRGILKAGEFTGRKAILSLPSVATFLQPVRIPVVPRQEVDGAVKKELEGKLPCPVEDAVIRHILAGTVYTDGQDMHERIVVAVPRRDLETYLTMAGGAGLDVVGVNIEACAVVECFARLLGRATDESRVTLFIDIGSASTQIALAHGQKMAFASNLMAGGKDLDEAFADAMHVSIEKAHSVRREMQSRTQDAAAQDEMFALLDGKIGEIADKITQCVRYYESVFRNRPIERVIFVGGQAHNKRLCQCIARRLNLPAQVGDPMAGIRRTDRAGWTSGLDARQPQPSWAVAIGLSLGATLAA